MNVVLSPDQLVSERLVGVYEAWKRTAQGRLGPKREAITPALVKSALPWIWMIDVLDGGRDYRFRLAGDRIIQFMGRRYAGQLLSEFSGQPFFDNMRRILNAVTVEKRPMVARPGPSTMPGREFVELEVVALPLSEDGESVTTIFGAMEIRLVPPGAKLPKGQ